MNIEVLWDGTFGLSSLSEKTRKSNRLQMSLQRQHFLLSYLRTLSVGPAGVRTHDLPHGSPVLNQLSQPVGICKRLFTLLNFLGAAILNFMLCYGCHYCYSVEVLLCETIEQPYYIMKSKMAAPGKFKSKNSR